MTFEPTVWAKIGRLCAKRASQGHLYTKGQRKHLANLVAAANRFHNRRPGTHLHMHALDAKRSILANVI